MSVRDELAELGCVNVSLLLRPAVYFLMHEGKVVYVGQSKLPLNRLANHRGAWGRNQKRATWRREPVKGIVFDEVWILRVGHHLLDEVEKKFIQQMRPRYNIKHNPRIPPELSALIASLIPSQPPQVAATPIAPVARHRRY